MKIDIPVELPSPYQDVELIKSVIGENNVVKGYTLTDDCKIVEVDCIIESNGSYNYHNNYDDSELVMKTKLNFNWEQRWFTLNKNLIQEKYNSNRSAIIGRLERIINEL